MTDADSDLPTYILERTFNAPRHLVWRTFTETDLLARWYGPNVETIVHRLDVRPGGLWLNEMKWVDNSHYQRVEYTEVAPPERLVWLHCVSDSNWKVAANPMMPDWPRTLLTTVTFRDQANAEGSETARTLMRLTWIPHEATDSEISCFRSAIEGMDKGWAAGMKILEEVLVELQK